MTVEEKEKLIDQVKRECKITWNSEETEEHIKEIVESAVPSMMHRLGVKEQDERELLEPGLAKRLLLKYCQYCWNNAEEYFEENYAKEILMQRHRYEVKYAKEENQ